MTANKVFHVDRDYSIAFSVQRKRLNREYENFHYLWTDGDYPGGGQIHFTATKKKTEEEMNQDKVERRAKRKQREERKRCQNLLHQNTE